MALRRSACQTAGGVAIGCAGTLEQGRRIDQCHAQLSGGQPPADQGRSRQSRSRAQLPGFGEGGARGRRGGQRNPHLVTERRERARQTGRNIGPERVDDFFASSSTCSLNCGVYHLRTTALCVFFGFIVLLGLRDYSLGHVSGRGGRISTRRCGVPCAAPGGCLDRQAVIERPLQLPVAVAAGRIGRDTQL